MIADAVASVRRRMAHAAEGAQRDPAGVRLLAVTKTVAASMVEEAIRAGVTDVGENRVYEALAKQPEVEPAARWHLIGHLQTNKSRVAAGVFDTVQSVDSLRVAESLSRHRRPEAGPLTVLVEVDLTGIAGRSGVDAQALPRLMASIALLPRLRLAGLMTIAPMASDPGAVRPYFARLRGLRDDVQEQLGAPLPVLSMGMSDDFEVAIQEGATMVRIGRALFGERTQP